MAFLAGGKFKMGQRGDEVTVRSFCLDVTEVTVNAYTRCVEAGRCSAGMRRTDIVVISACNYGLSERGNHPMNCADWAQSEGYCNWHSGRLPTEEEWEWAARGGMEGRFYPWGSQPPGSQVCWSGLQARSSTCPVGSFPAGNPPSGIQDLAGNVIEWTATEFDGKSRVVRGGCWAGKGGVFMPAAARNHASPTHRDTLLGFRCARTPAL
jgi:formylglycine-generating enzyme required for sulfatase activity